MDGIIFLTVDDVLQIHLDQIARYGGREGILDLTLIESAIAQPCATYCGQFLHEDIAAMAAAYLFHLAKNHGFEDGNKRVGATAAMVFLEMNDVQIVQFEEGAGEVDD